MAARELCSAAPIPKYSFVISVTHLEHVAAADVSSPSGDVEDAGHGAFAVVQENIENGTYRSTRFELCGRR